MRLLEKMCFVVLASGLALGQATAPNSGSAQSGSVSDDLKALREAISQQQQQIAQQQQQLQALQQKLDEKNSSKQGSKMLLRVPQPGQVLRTRLAWPLAHRTSPMHH